VSDASSATLGFIGKLVAKAGFVEVSSASRLLPSRMSVALKDEYGGDLARLVTQSGEPFGLTVGGGGSLIMSMAVKPKAAVRPTTPLAPPPTPVVAPAPER
jgi:hypothetical protein